MPSRAPCSTGASYSYTSFGKHGIVNTQSILNHSKSDFIQTSPFSKSDLKRQSLNTYSSPFSKSDSKRRSLKSVRFAEPSKEISPVIDNDENLVNERLEMSAADVMAEALYATVRKRHSPVKERLMMTPPSQMIPQVPLNIQPAGYRNHNDVIYRQNQQFQEQRRAAAMNGGGEIVCNDDERGFRPYNRKLGLEAKHFRQNTDLWINEFKVR